MRHLRGSKGTSVIEVLVVMVVLLVGILVIVNLFPPGFASVRRAEAMTLAGRLDQQEMERWANRASNLPDGVVPIDTANSVLNDQFPGPPVDNNNVTTMRRIIGETTRIPFGGWSTGPTSGGSVYMLAFAPVDVQYSAAGTPTNFAVRGSALTRRVLDSSSTDGPGAWQTLSPSQYGIDFDDSKIVFPISGQDRVYWITLSWWEQPAGGGAPIYKTASDLQVPVAANTASWRSIGGAGSNVVVPVTAGNRLVGLDDYSETVSRGFSPVANFSSDPYEYKLINAALGIIAFNPLGYAQKEFGRPLEAKIDYDILDLQIIREDKRVPANAPYKVSMTLNRIKQAGVTTEWDGSPYQWIHPLIHADIVAVDLESGYEVSLTGATVDYKAGTVELPDTLSLGGGGTVPAAGRNLRFFYKAEWDWSLQFHKAYWLFTSSDGQSPLDYKSYACSGDTFYFAACNSNDTMSLTYEYSYTTGNGANRISRKVVGQCLRTTDVLTDYHYTDKSGAAQTQKCTSIALNLASTPGADPGSVQINRIFSVNGVSVRVRTCWRDSDKWRNVDLDTTLLKRPGT